VKPFQNPFQVRVLPANSPTGCTANSTEHGSGLRARRGAPFAVTRISGLKPLFGAVVICASTWLYAQNRAPADLPSPRTDENSKIAHQQLLEKAAKGGIDVYFIGDSIARRWGATDYPELLANWKENFFGWNAADFGWGADRTENILWRLENGELDGVNPKVIVILAGTNNIGTAAGGAAKVADITRGIAAIVHVCRQRAPAATIILTAIFPRNDNMAVMPEIDTINDIIARLADGKVVRYLNVNDRLADKDGRLFDAMMNARDKLHPTLKGYQVWADGLKPILRELLGPPAGTDHAPPPTGDPSAAGRGRGAR
jgi:lysophospholipase L1-like esterase